MGEIAPVIPPYLKQRLFLFTKIRGMLQRKENLPCGMPPGRFYAFLKDIPGKSL